MKDVKMTSNFRMSSYQQECRDKRGNNKHE